MAAVTQVRILVTAWTIFSFSVYCFENFQKLRRPGIEPGSTAWKAAMLTIIPPTLTSVKVENVSFILLAFEISAAR